MDVWAKRWKVLFVVLLCSCATQRQAGQQQTQPAAPQESERDGQAQLQDAAAAPGQLPQFYPPATRPLPYLEPKRLALKSSPEPAATKTPTAVAQKCPPCTGSITTKTVYLENTKQLDSLRRELSTERLANNAIRVKLTAATRERDYWQGLTRKKFWSLLAMAIFGLLFILFKVLANRVQTSGQV